MGGGRGGGGNDRRAWEDPNHVVHMHFKHCMSAQVLHTHRDFVFTFVIVRWYHRKYTGLNFEIQKKGLT